MSHGSLKQFMLLGMAILKMYKINTKKQTKLVLKKKQYTTLDLPTIYRKGLITK